MYVRNAPYVKYIGIHRRENFVFIWENNVAAYANVNQLLSLFVGNRIVMELIWGVYYTCALHIIITTCRGLLFLFCINREHQLIRLYKKVRKNNWNIACSWLFGAQVPFSRPLNILILIGRAHDLWVYIRSSCSHRLILMQILSFFWTVFFLLRCPNNLAIRCHWNRERSRHLWKCWNIIWLRCVHKIDRKR